MHELLMWICVGLCAWNIYWFVGGAYAW